jgi:hypothetical protein
MRRSIFNLAAVISLGLCATVVLLWVRSYMSETLLFESHSGRLLIIGMDSGAAAVRESRNSRTCAQFLAELFQPQYFSKPPQENRCLGFYVASGDSGKDGPFHIVAVPHWFAFVLMAIVPSVWIWRMRAAQRRRLAGLCPACGYDLRGTPDRCPECGAIPDRPLRTAA